MPQLENLSIDQHRQALTRAKAAALRFLATRSRSVAEVRRRLALRYSPDVVQTIIEDMQEQGYLNDIAFAKEWREQRERTRPRSEMQVRQELLRLGVEEDVVKEALAGFDACENAYLAAHSLAYRLNMSDYPQFRRRLWSYLYRRGFDPTVTGDTVLCLWRELTDSLNRDINASADEQQTD